jgi:hypothetical protein
MDFFKQGLAKILTRKRMKDCRGQRSLRACAKEGQALTSGHVGRGRCRAAHEAHLELLAMGAIVDPLARGSDPLAGADRGGMAENGDQVAVATRLDPEHAEAVVGVVEGDALDQAGEDLAVRCVGLLARLGVLQDDPP